MIEMIIDVQDLCSEGAAGTQSGVVLIDVGHRSAADQQEIMELVDHEDVDEQTPSITTWTVVTQIHSSSGW